MDPRLDLWKKHLLGRTIAVRNDTRVGYQGVIQDIICTPDVFGGAMRLITAKGSPYSFNVQYFFDGFIYTVRKEETDSGSTMGEEPIIDACVPISEIIERDIFKEAESDSN